MCRVREKTSKSEGNDKDVVRRKAKKPKHKGKREQKKAEYKHQRKKEKKTRGKETKHNYASNVKRNKIVCVCVLCIF